MRSPPSTGSTHCPPMNNLYASQKKRSKRMNRRRVPCIDRNRALVNRGVEGVSVSLWHVLNVKLIWMGITFSYIYAAGNHPNRFVSRMNAVVSIRTASIPPHHLDNTFPQQPMHSWTVGKFKIYTHPRCISFINKPIVICFEKDLRKR